jgi:hypothetical protein
MHAHSSLCVIGEGVVGTSSLLISARYLIIINCLNISCVVLIQGMLVHQCFIDIFRKAIEKCQKHGF